MAFDLKYLLVCKKLHVRGLEVVLSFLSDKIKSASFKSAAVCECRYNVSLPFLEPAERSREARVTVLRALSLKRRHRTDEMTSVVNNLTACSRG